MGVITMGLDPANVNEERAGIPGMPMHVQICMLRLQAFLHAEGRCISGLVSASSMPQSVCWACRCL